MDAITVEIRGRLPDREGSRPHCGGDEGEPVKPVKPGSVKATEVLRKAGGYKSPPGIFQFLEAALYLSSCISYWLISAVSGESFAFSSSIRNS